jgi:predicted thioesterase
VVTKAELKEINGPKLTFTVNAYEVPFSLILSMIPDDFKRRTSNQLLQMPENKLIGTGTHRRAVINIQD